MKKKNGKHILVIGSSASPHVVSRMAGFTQRGYHITILTEQIADVDEMEEISLYPTYNEMTSSIWAKFFYKINRVRELKNIYKKLKIANPDIIHIHFALNRLGILFAFSLGKPLIVSVMGGDILFNEQRSAKWKDKFLVRQLLKRANEITAKSDYLANEVLKFGDYENKTQKVIWGVDTNHFIPFEEHDLKEELKLPESSQIVFCPKALQPLYNINLIIDAISIIRDEFPGLILLLTDFNSDPEYKKSLDEQIRDLKLETSVLFVDQIAHTEIVRYYNLADIIIGIPDSDGLPQTLLESMACAKPHILGNLERYKEIVADGESAIFTDLNPAEIAGTVKKLLLDKSLSKKIGERAREIVLDEADMVKSLGIMECIYQKYLPDRKQTYGS